jgi:glycosyltransferase involved in cell wall biosynthesis
MNNSAMEWKSMARKLQTPGRKRPTVLICAPVYLPSQGGASTYFSTLIKMLNSKVDFVVFTQSLKEVETIEHQGNIKIYRIQPNLIDAPGPVKYFVIPPITLFALFAFWLKYRMVIHAHSNGIFGFTISMFSSLFRIKMIKEVQDTSDPPYNLKLGQVAKYGSIGYTIEKKLLKIGIPKSRIIAYPSMLPPSDKEKFKDLNLRKVGDGKDKFTKLLCVAAFWPSKGLDTLLEAMKIVEKRNNNVKLTIIGDGPERANLELLMTKNKLRSVSLVGFKPRDIYLTKYLANTDISVLPSRSGEGNPFVILEAFQFARPVIATKVGGTPELVKNNKTGLLIEPENPEQLAESILKLVHDKKLQKELGENGKKLLSTFPTWNDLSKEIYNEYLRIWEGE